MLFVCVRAFFFVEEGVADVQDAYNKVRSSGHRFEDT